MTSRIYVKRHVWLVLPIAVLFGVAMQLRPVTSAAKAAPAVPQPVPVSVAVARTQSLPLWLNAIGTVTPLNAVSVRSRVDGQLQDVKFVEGQHVKAGELLATIDPRPFQITLAQANAVLAQEQARLASYRVDFQRADSLAKAGAGPAQAADTLRAQVVTQRAAVQAAQATADAAKLQLSFTRVVSPVDGRAGQRLAALGAMVHTTDATGLVTVTQMNPIWVSFAVPQDVLPAVLHSSAGKPLRVTALERDGGRPLAEGELVFVDSQIAPTNGQVQLKARFDNAKSELWPGGLVAVKILLRTQADATVVPREAVQQGADGAFVYVSDASHAAQVRQVVAGDVVDGMQWIRTGLQPGETVVTQGQSRIAAGTPLAPAASGASSATTGAGQ